MNVNTINKLLSLGKLNEKGLFPHLDDLKQHPFSFSVDFGLAELPKEPGVLLIRGPRQYGKSTWLEGELKTSAKQFGPASSYYLNGDFFDSQAALTEAIRELVPLYSTKAPLKRLFIDEITAVKGWERSLKSLIDAGELRDVLVVTTGSKASDLRRGEERLPGRKGKLARSSYLFTPISFAEFASKAKKAVATEHLVPLYLLSGGSPLALTELITNGKIPEYVIELVRDWIFGECTASGRDRGSLVAVFEVLFTFGGTPVGQMKLAREAGLANNTTAAGYCELLQDLLVLGSLQQWDPERRRVQRRKPAKFSFMNTLAVIAFHPSRLRTLEGFAQLSPDKRGQLYEWLLHQELYRRRAIRGEDFPADIPFWRDTSHEIDFIDEGEKFYEAKSGETSPLDFSWFPKRFPKSELTVISQSEFQSKAVKGVTFERFLSGKEN